MLCPNWRQIPHLLVERFVVVPPSETAFSFCDGKDLMFVAVVAPFTSVIMLLWSKAGVSVSVLSNVAVSMTLVSMLQSSAHSISSC